MNTAPLTREHGPVDRSTGPTRPARQRRTLRHVKGFRARRFESPWVAWRLLTLETRMESCQTKDTSGKPTTRRYTDEEKAQAVRLVRQLRAELGTEHGTVFRVANQLGYGVESVRTWVRQADIDDGDRRDEHRGSGADQGARAGEPRAASGQRDLEAGVGFLRGGARPPTAVIVEFIDANRDELGVEPICEVLQVAPSTYYAAKPARRRPGDPRRAVIPPRRAVGGELPGLRGPKCGRPPARRRDIGRDQVARLMRRRDRGVRRRQEVRTTRPDDGARHPDLVDRDSPRPRRTSCGSPT